MTSYIKPFFQPPSHGDFGDGRKASQVTMVAIITPHPQSIMAETSSFIFNGNLQPELKYKPMLQWVWYLNAYN